MVQGRAEDVGRHLVFSSQEQAEATNIPLTPGSWRDAVVLGRVLQLRCGELAQAPVALWLWQPPPQDLAGDRARDTGNLVQASMAIMQREVRKYVENKIVGQCWYSSGFSKDPARSKFVQEVFQK